MLFKQESRLQPVKIWTFLNLVYIYTYIISCSVCYWRYCSIATLAWFIRTDLEMPQGHGNLWLWFEKALSDSKGLGVYSILGVDALKHSCVIADCHLLDRTRSTRACAQSAKTYISCWRLFGMTSRWPSIVGEWVPIERKASFAVGKRSCFASPIFQDVSLTPLHINTLLYNLLVGMKCLQWGWSWRMLWINHNHILRKHCETIMNSLFINLFNLWRETSRPGAFKIFDVASSFLYVYHTLQAIVKLP